ncbi:WhiB family transcriptional regulator [Streptacidiphilus anmyonensis]|uniref:WhiB family transcriptional regulator n=1 Tax=Streptacidiphilus anmyonensis TaxID=405782 RepID=UPI0007C7349F|nr:WhiB family transcriptional regulator [Streptacidiphilus anmyonensis]
MARRRHTAIRARIPYGAPQPGAAITLTVPKDTDLTGALCTAVTPELFFPDPDEAELAELVAKRVCAACPVRMTCLNAAIGRDERFGVFGGLNTAERDALTGRLDGCGTPNGYWHHRNAGDPPCRACHTAKTAVSAAKKARTAGRERGHLEAAA